MIKCLFSFILDRLGFGQRERLDLKRVDLLDEDGNLADTDEKLNQALSVALIEEDESSDEIEGEEVEEALSHLAIEEDRVNVQESIDWSLFQVSYKVCTP